MLTKKMTAFKGPGRTGKLLTGEIRNVQSSEELKYWE